MAEAAPKATDHCTSNLSSAPTCRQDLSLVRRQLQHWTVLGLSVEATLRPPGASIVSPSCKILRRCGQHRACGQQEDAKDARGYVHVHVQAACGQLTAALPAGALPAGAAAATTCSALPELERSALANPAFQTAGSWGLDSREWWEADSVDSLDALVAQLVGSPAQSVLRALLLQLCCALVHQVALLLETPAARQALTAQVLRSNLSGALHTHTSWASLQLCSPD